MIIELHLLQSFPVSNLNRDDVGQPKTATFGGYTRGRISSQCLKRAARQLFTDFGLDKSETAVRTKRLLDRAVAALTDRGRDAELASQVVTAGLQQLGFGVDENKGLTQYLLFVGQHAIDHLASYCDNNWDTLHGIATKAKAVTAKAKSDNEKPGTNEQRKSGKVAKPDKAAIAEARRILDASRVSDVALFGRMIADNKDFSVEAACQVAHAISTHAVINEFDYYTAVDDLKPREESGADMIGTIDFNSACYYRYANLNLEQLAHNLAGDQDLINRTARAWLYSFIHAVPSGAQNSMAARTMPDTLLGVVRDRGAWNLANAFQRPVTDADIMAASTERLTHHFRQLRTFYGNTDLRDIAAASVTGDVPHFDDTEIVAGIDDFTGRVLTGATA
ncbi:type I-E CRISPR-associated protein Cas7/Cse4/CasC [Lentzea sp. DG1S-22]|uniref:type I-E CRISPR-associated protein Cas7/Cse4/CasC n=1 Tax=Lentzea sp. DG1S-22 TaxID=3108822 RepID=UPI002E787176|nr:type I-E CRISPR-associated protein Cas7/Cse4/CasC [Lentzea sp. DG1S-22]WVH82761.1 type I-E CRISPR-associated protein Cas7/Cse4/CasC [Lentzea sp. DG1S-22]